MRLMRLLAVLFLLLSPAVAAADPADPRFTAIVEGSGPDVILIPGLSSSSDVWTATSDRLKARFRVHRLQVAGFAGAPAGSNAEGPVVAPLAEAIAAYIGEHELQAPAVIGHSLGGEAALMLASRHPDRVGRVMTVDSLPFYSLLLDPRATAESVRRQAAAMRDMLLGQSDAQFRAVAPVTIARMVKREAARPSVIGWSVASDRDVVARAVHELMTTDLRPELGLISAPLTIVYAHDPAYGVPAERFDALFRSAFAGAADPRFERIDDSFHFIMLDQPEAFAAAVDRFLESR